MGIHLGNIGRVVVVATLAVAINAVSASPAHAEPVPLNGLFGIDGGVCSGGSVTGSFFRMILPAGDRGGPYLSNSDSGCSDQTVTPLSPGTSGGLISGEFQPQPAQAFDGAGNAISGSVTTPVKFYGVGFATATNPTDPQTGQGTALPQILVDGTALTGDLSGFGVTWNRQVFNQGSPKPGGGLSGNTTAVTGTIDRAGGAYVLEWTSQIVGGPFDNFTGLWHLAGTYQGEGLAPVAAPAAPGGSTPAATPGATAPGAAPPAPPADAPANTPPAAQPVVEPNSAAQQANPSLTATTIEVPTTESSPRWLLPVLVVVTAVAAGVLTNVDRLFRRRRPGDDVDR